MLFRSLLSGSELPFAPIISVAIPLLISSSSTKALSLDNLLNSLSHLSSMKNKIVIIKPMMAAIFAINTALVPSFLQTTVNVTAIRRIVTAISNTLNSTLHNFNIRHLLSAKFSTPSPAPSHHFSTQTSAMRLSTASALTPQRKALQLQVIDAEVRLGRMNLFYWKKGKKRGKEKTEE